MRSALRIGRRCIFRRYLGSCAPVTNPQLHQVALLPVPIFGLTPNPPTDVRPPHTLTFIADDSAVLRYLRRPDILLALPLAKSKVPPDFTGRGGTTVTSQCRNQGAGGYGGHDLKLTMLGTEVPCQAVGTPAVYLLKRKETAT